MFFEEELFLQRHFPFGQTGKRSTQRGPAGKMRHSASLKQSPERSSKPVQEAIHEWTAAERTRPRRLRIPRHPLYTRWKTEGPEFCFLKYFTSWIHFLDVGGFQGDHAEVIRASQRKVWVETMETASGPLTAMPPLVHSRAQPPVLTQRDRLSSACSLWKETFP